jgi:hypothetical protein
MIRAIYFKQATGRNLFWVKVVETAAGEDDKQKVEMFFSFPEARQFLSSERRQWLLAEFQKYVKHKGILFRSSSGDHYRNQARLEALTRLENAVKLLPEMETKRLCSVITSAQALLKQILPHPANPSYDDAYTKVLDLVAVAGDELNDVLGIFQFKSSKTEVYL